MLVEQAEGVELNFLPGAVDGDVERQPQREEQRQPMKFVHPDTNYNAKRGDGIEPPTAICTIDLLDEPLFPRHLFPSAH